MAEYIKRETAVDAILGEPTDAHYPEWYASILMGLPTVDAVPIVRCQDCQNRGTIFCPVVHETLGNGLVDYTSDDGYCWHGREINNEKNPRR